MQSASCIVENCFQNCCTVLGQCPDPTQPLTGPNSCFYFSNTKGPIINESNGNIGFMLPLILGASIAGLLILIVLGVFVTMICLAKRIQTEPKDNIKATEGNTEGEESTQQRKQTQGQELDKDTLDANSQVFFNNENKERLDKNSLADA